MGQQLFRFVPTTPEWSRSPV